MTSASARTGLVECSAADLPPDFFPSATQLAAALALDLSLPGRSTSSVGRGPVPGVLAGWVGAVSRRARGDRVSGRVVGNRVVLPRRAGRW